MKAFAKIAAFTLLFCCCHPAFSQTDSLKIANKSVVLMGSAFGLTAIHADEAKAWQAIEAGIAEIQRIERLISSWDPHSQTSAINRQAGIAPVKVDGELYDLIARSKKISALTGGAFDISFASINKVWQFDGSMQRLPSKAAIAASVDKINFENINLDAEESTVFLKEKGMKIGFGGIGKGYAANMARTAMRDLGIEHGLVNAGGDLITWGRQADGAPWQIAVAAPGKTGDVLGWLDASDLAVVTSGDYERYAEIDGKRYAHIIDPHTGWPVQGIQSVTVICPDAELADALATAVFVLGKDEGLDLINQLRGVECFLFDDENEMHSSQNLRLEYVRTKGGKE